MHKARVQHIKMKCFILTLLIVFGFTACSEEKVSSYDGKALLEQKCASCHNLDMPPHTYEDEKAPPMMAVAFHIKDFIPVNAPSDKKPKFIAFFQDFVLAPSKEKSFCDPKSLKDYGLMPSMKGKVSKEALGAIAEYVFMFYNQEKFLAQMQAKAAFEARPRGEQLAIQKGCLTCHGKDRAKVAPAFSEIAKKDANEIIDVIQNGSKGKWKGFERMMMPSFKDKLTPKELEILRDWILTF